MSKILSIIVPTYNMEALLPQCLDSLISSKEIAKLDIIVVNDGSKDKSSDIAHEYEKREPHSIVVIDKKNGNYGSTINAALPIAKGKYVKILDSDDKFDTDVLNKFVAELETINSDLVYTPFTEVCGNGKKNIVRYNTLNREVYEYGKEFQVDDILKDGHIRYFLMHGIAWRTELLKKNEYKQTEGISYTDTEWDNYPTYYFKTVTLLNDNLYLYNLGREGQTMSNSAITKNINQFDIVCTNLINYYSIHKGLLSDTRDKWMRKYLENRISYLFRILLIKTPREYFDKESAISIDIKYNHLCNENNLHPTLYPENKILRINYIKYWHEKHKLWPKWLCSLNQLLDKITKFAYINFIRK